MIRLKTWEKKIQNVISYRYRCIVEFVNVNDTQNEVEKSWEKVPPIYSATDGDTSTQPATDGEPSQGNIRSISVERKHLPSISFRRPHRLSICEWATAYLLEWSLLADC